MRQQRGFWNDEHGEVPQWVTGLAIGIFLLAFISIFVFGITGREDLMLVMFALIFFITGLVAIYAAWWFYGKYALIKNTATERVRSIAMGRTEVEGVFRPDETVFDQPFREGKCLFADWKVEEYTDSNDDGSWTTLHSERLSAPFYFEDDTGQVLVEPDGSTVEISDGNTYSTTYSPGTTPSDRIVEFCESKDISPTSSNQRRYTQEILTEGMEGYVLGDAERLESPDAHESTGNVVINDGDGERELIISDKEEDELVRHYKIGTVVTLVYGLVTSTGSVYFLLTQLQSLGLL